MERIDKVLCNLNYGSRNEIKKMIKDGCLKINGVIEYDQTRKVDYTDKIIFDDEVVFYKQYVYLKVNKPSGYISDKDYRGTEKTVFDLIKEPYCRYDLKVCGRLDKDTEGLVILTNDGNYIHNITSDKKDIFKKYFVITKNRITDTNKLEAGVYITVNKEKYLTKEAKVELIDEKSCYIYIKEGKFHQVKLMFMAIDNEVVYLKRIMIGDISCDDLLSGEYCEILI